jgi:CheY-specific phosphatase CheX
MTSPTHPPSAVVDAIVDAVVRVTKIVLGEEARVVARRPDLAGGDGPTHAVRSQFSGGLRGVLTWEITPELARQVADALTFGAASAADHPAAASELANMFVGQAADALTEAGYAVEIHPPADDGLGARSGSSAFAIAFATGGEELIVRFDLEAP